MDHALFMDSTVCQGLAPMAAPQATQTGAPSETWDLAALYQRHAPFLLRNVERLTGAGPHVEDVVQEVFLVAHARAARLGPQVDLKAWLYGVAVNMVRHHRRSFARRQKLDEAYRQQPSPAPGSPEHALERRRQALAIRHAVLNLPLVYREVFVLFELEGLGGKDVAALLEVPESTVWTRLHKGRKRFKQLLGHTLSSLEVSP